MGQEDLGQWRRGKGAAIPTLEEERVCVCVCVCTSCVCVPSEMLSSQIQINKVF